METISVGILCAAVAATDPVGPAREKPAGLYLTLSGLVLTSTGVRIAQEMLEAAKDRVVGSYIMPPLMRYESALQVLSVVGYDSE